MANQGPIPVREAWRVDKNRSKEFKHDGTNFFQVTEKVPMSEIGKESS